MAPMLRKLTYVGIGIVLGISIQFALFPFSRLKHRTVARAKVLKSGVIESSVAPLSTPAPESTATAATPPSERTDRLVINEQNVEEMEHRREELRRYAFTVQDREGWKIQLLPEDKVFMKAGLSSGDLITFRSMNDQLRNPERAPLAVRMVAILNLIQK
jgi:hypothetical protein